MTDKPKMVALMEDILQEARKRSNSHIVTEELVFEIAKEFGVEVIVEDEYIRFRKKFENN